MRRRLVLLIFALMLLTGCAAKQDVPECAEGNAIAAIIPALEEEKPKDELQILGIEPAPEPEVVRKASKALLLGEEFPLDSTSFSFPADAITTPEDLKGLESFGKLKTVDLRDGEKTLAEMDAISAAYPQITFLFSFSLTELGLNEEAYQLDSLTTEELDLSRQINLDLEILRKYLRHLPELRELNMCDCGISNEEMEKLREEFPEVKIIWRVYLKSYSLRTDAEVFSTLVEDDKHPYLTGEDCEVLKYCTDLLALDLGHHSIEDVSFLSNLPNLHVLILALNKITDITPIATCTELRYLEIFGNDYDSLAPLSALSKLEDLNISYAYRIEDYEPLYSLTNLKRLWMNRCPISEEGLELLQRKLPACEIVCIPTEFAVSAGWRVSERYDALQRTFGGDSLDPLFK